MDYFGIKRTSLRGEALKKLAKLSAEQPPAIKEGLSNGGNGGNANGRNVNGEKVNGSRVNGEKVNGEKVGAGITDIFEMTDRKNGSPKISDVAMSGKEFEVLVALCDSAEAIVCSKKAELFLERIRLYLRELPSQRFSKSVFRRTAGSNPWYLLSEKLASAVSKVGTREQGKLGESAQEILKETFRTLFKSARLETSHFCTLLGFIEGFIRNPLIFTVDENSIEAFLILNSFVEDSEFLGKVEKFSGSEGSYSGEHVHFLDQDFTHRISPILFLERTSKLMCSIVSSIYNCDIPLMSFLVETLLNESYVTEDESKQESLLRVSDHHSKIIKSLTDVALKKIEFFNRGHQQIVYSDILRLKTGYFSKSYNLQIIGCGLVTNQVELQVARNVLKSNLAIHDLMLDPDLGYSLIQLNCLLVFRDELFGPVLTRTVTSLVMDTKFDVDYCSKAAKMVGLTSSVLSQDAVVTTIYALSNLIFVGNDSLQAKHTVRRSTGIKRLDSSAFRNASSGTGSGSESGNWEHGTPLKEFSRFNGRRMSNSDYTDSDFKKVCQNSVNAIVEIVKICKDEKVSTLAVTILSQKVSKLDSNIGNICLKGLVSCAPYLPEKEFKILCRLLNKLTIDVFVEGNEKSLNLLMAAKIDLSHKIDQSNELFEIYLHDILQNIISKGDVQELEHHRSHNEISSVGDQISIHLKPLAELLPDPEIGSPSLRITNSTTINLFRNIWFNLVVHGYSITSRNTNKYIKELQRIAYNTPPLASELSWNRTETSLELNTVLKRGSSNHNVKDHKHIMGDIFEVHRTMSYPKLMFLSATVFVESLRVKTGDCSTILQYYTDPSVKTSGVDKYIGVIAEKIVNDFVQLTYSRNGIRFSSDLIAEQLTNMLSLCCHRLNDLQEAALRCCDILINKIPSSLARHRSLFALFDLLTLLFQSILDAEENQYEPTTSYRAAKTGILISLSDSYKWRNDTFVTFQEKARVWMKLVLVKCNFDVKTLIQLYVSDDNGFQHKKDIQYGVSFALEMAGSILANDRELSSTSTSAQYKLNTLPSFISHLSRRSEFITEAIKKVTSDPNQDSSAAFVQVRKRLLELDSSLEDPQTDVPPEKISGVLSECGGLTLISEQNAGEKIRLLTDIPFKSLDPKIMSEAIGVWLAVIKDSPKLSTLTLSEIAKKWEASIELRKGLFSKSTDILEPEFQKMEYSPSDFKSVIRLAEATRSQLDCHLQIIRLFSSHFQATLHQSDNLLRIFTKFVEVGLKNLSIASLHPYARLPRFELIRFSFDVLNYHIKTGSRIVERLVKLILDATLSWFRKRRSYPFGSDSLKIKADYGILEEVSRLISHTDASRNSELEIKKELATFFLDDEIANFSVWLNPLHPNNVKGVSRSHIDNRILSQAYKVDPILAINLANRSNLKHTDEILQGLIAGNPLPAVFYPDAVQYFLGVNAKDHKPTHELIYWDVQAPIDAIRLFLPPFGTDPYTLQYTMRSLEHHDVNLTFFYVPQIVQCLRYDAKGYVEKFIIETAKVSQLFAHQIIWNMKANSYKDEDSTEPDEVKPTLDRIQKHILDSYSGEDLLFYQREFSFFNEVTNISGKLKPYIKKSKAERKLKIDEEIAKVKLEDGVYLPSNPDGVVVDINRKSGKPLQSHAKAPFMATFKIKKDVTEIDERGRSYNTYVEKWQSAIFKVGDDCRQDVLALQLISVFRSIWSSAGLDLYVYPNRVTATAPGCGVIDVLPNSISRDMLGREAVNGLYEYFTTKFGPESSIEFQRARNNLIKSLAAYSIISYLLQFKDRHNGNIMYDSDGHILHIDFGFCFDIVPGGVKFEAVPFKLTHEMVMVLGGRSDTQAFQWFEEVCVKGYLACRPYMETIVRMVVPMLDSGLPCFNKSTIRKLRARFVPNKSDKDAANFMKGLIRKSLESFYTKGYDEFQRITNGIPY